MKQIILLSASVLALAACQAPKTTHQTTHSTATATPSAPQTYNQADHYDTRVHNVTGKSYLCDNGFTAGVSFSSSNQMLLSVAYGMPKPATAQLNRQNDGSYVSHMGLFGKGAHWQNTSSQTAKLSYAMNDGRAASTICTAE